MTAARLQIIDDEGTVQVADSMRSVHESRTAVEAALRVADDFPPGWTVRLWLDVPLVGTLDSLGEPHAVITNPAAAPDGNSDDGEGG